MANACAITRPLHPRNNWCACTRFWLSCQPFKLVSKIKSPLCSGHILFQRKVNGFIGLELNFIWSSLSGQRERRKLKKFNGNKDWFVTTFKKFERANRGRNYILYLLIFFNFNRFQKQILYSPWIEIYVSYFGIHIFITEISNFLKFEDSLLDF